MKKHFAARCAALITALMLALGVTGCSSAEEAISTAEVIYNVVSELQSEAEQNNTSAQKPEAEDPAETSVLEESGNNAANLPFEQNSGSNELTESEAQEKEDLVAYGEEYNTMQEVADYLHLYEELPPNYLTKKEAEEKGWISSKGNLWDVAEGSSIGGDYFGNREGLLPQKKGRKYYECDINYEGGYRGSERIIYSNDGLVFYTNDHYASFTQLYGDDAA